MLKRFDFIMHWLWTIVWSLLALSGFSMVGAKYGWLLNYDYALAINVHRVTAAIFVMLTAIAIGYEIVRAARKNEQKVPWLVIGRSGYQMFTFITTLILIISGAILWVCSEMDVKAATIALWLHENVSYLSLASVVWHMYKKGHALVGMKRKEDQAVQGAKGRERNAKTLA